MDGKGDRRGEDSTEAIKIGDENGHFFVPSALGSPNRNKKRQRPKKIGLTHPLWASSKEAGLVFFEHTHCRRFFLPSPPLFYRLW